MKLQKIVKGWFAMRDGARWAVVDQMREIAAEMGGELRIVHVDGQDVGFQVIGADDIDWRELVTRLWEAVQGEISQLVITGVETRATAVREVDDIDQLWEAVWGFEEATGMEARWRLVHHMLEIWGSKERSELFVLPPDD